MGVVRILSHEHTDIKSPGRNAGYQSTAVNWPCWVELLAAASAQHRSAQESDFLFKRLTLVRGGGAKGGLT